MATSQDRELAEITRQLILGQPNALKPVQPTPSGPALVLLDINMPVMDGFEFLKAFQALPPGQQRCAVMVVLTSSLNTQDIDRSNNLPIAGFLSKPLNRDKITQVLHQHFGLPVAAE